MSIDYSHHPNARRLSKAAAKTAATCVQNLNNWGPAVKEIQTWPEYQPQPLRDLPQLAKTLGLGNVFIKDESRRFGTDLGSFKALGAPFAVCRILSDEVHRQTGAYPSSAELRTSKYHHITQQVTVCVATDGNQGRGLAYGAKVFGCRCVDYIHGHVSPVRAKMMKDLGAIVIRIDGEYDESVFRAKEDARMNGWHFDVMNAYMVVAEEALEMLPSLQDITHVFVCGGVGSIAAAIFLGFYKHFDEISASNSTIPFPRCVVIEPTEADCLLQSAKAGELRQSNSSLRTLMAGLACRGPSPAAWKILEWLSSDFIAVPDRVAVDGMIALAEGKHGDVPVVCGESSAATMGVLLKAGNNKAFRERLGLDARSQCVIFGLEGATDPSIYKDLVGKSPEDVFKEQDVFLQLHR
ncbi:tryptophan synthase beta subunit-like PLP-dependent enzyme [Colletotrichum godetiae]|uniref:Tryptophan synthase beta subunit-like PLP-dependent enzyme n=1 Tax=Colletotrichum godetiae TaxID=1209918 RepID=A0AAJ0B035_9PEZI|nr:tryptophan synthase beta subunit-like PLP-dependent enzyme [Colletotrichum godetiae]KAK1701479.1 tryptophan synthase beta subunit-like PLP-dependent enzyme [Colletotrichum godetiae]